MTDLSYILSSLQIGKTMETESTLIAFSSSESIDLNYSTVSMDKNTMPSTLGEHVTQFVQTVNADDHIPDKETFYQTTSVSNDYSPKLSSIAVEGDINMDSKTCVQRLTESNNNFGINEEEFSSSFSLSASDLNNQSEVDISMCDVSLVNSHSLQVEQSDDATVSDNAKSYDMIPSTSKEFSESHFKNALKKSLKRELYSPRITRSSSTDSTEKNLPPRVENRRCTKRPSKSTNFTSEDAIKHVYLNKNTKFSHKLLETIYEDPQYKKGDMVLTAQTKVRRYLVLDKEFRVVSKTKSKLRKTRIKRLLGSKHNKRMSEEEFKEKMANLDKFFQDSDS